MQVLLVIVGLVLVGMGLLFAVTGVGGDRAEGEGRGITLKAPAWLFLVVIGVLLMWFAGTRDWDGDTEPNGTVAPTTQATAAPTTQATAAPSTEGTSPPPTNPPQTDAPQNGCVIGIGNPLASISVEPDPFARELGRVPAGSYQVLEIRDVTFVTEQRWFLIEVDGQQGWIMDSTILIDSKTADCNL